MTTATIADKAAVLHEQRQADTNREKNETEERYWNGYVSLLMVKNPTDEQLNDLTSYMNDLAISANDVRKDLERVEQARRMTSCHLRREQLAQEYKMNNRIFRAKEKQLSDQQFLMRKVVDTAASNSKMASTESPYNLHMLSRQRPQLFKRSVEANATPELLDALNGEPTEPFREPKISTTDSLAREINHAIFACRRDVMSCYDFAVQAGELLISAKAKHGAGYRAWVDANVWGQFVTACRFIGYAMHNREVVESEAERLQQLGRIDMPNECSDVLQAADEQTAKKKPSPAK